MHLRCSFMLVIFLLAGSTFTTAATTDSPAEYGTTKGFSEETTALEEHGWRDEEELIEATAEPARCLCKHEIAIIALALLLVLAMVVTLLCCQLLTYGITCGRHRFTLRRKGRTNAEDVPQVVFNRV